MKVTKTCGRIAWSLVLACVGILLAPRLARADLIQFEFQGVVTNNTGDLGVFGPLSSVNIGDIITGRLSYETGPGNPDQQPGDSNIGLYDLLEFVIDQAVVPITPDGILVFRAPPVPQLDPNAPPDPGSDLFRAVGAFESGGDGYVVALTLAAAFGAVFPDDVLPASLALGAFTDARNVRAIRTSGLGSLLGQIDEAELVPLTSVPEPSSLVLLSIGASGLALLRRRGLAVCLTRGDGHEPMFKSARGVRSRWARSGSGHRGVQAGH
jgi:hypothetical protein